MASFKYQEKTKKQTFYTHKKNLQKIKTKIKTLTKQANTEGNQCQQSGAIRKVKVNNTTC